MQWVSPSPFHIINRSSLLTLSGESGVPPTLGLGKPFPGSMFLPAPAPLLCSSSQLIVLKSLSALNAYQSSPRPSTHSSQLWLSPLHWTCSDCLHVDQLNGSSPVLIWIFAILLSELLPHSSYVSFFRTSPHHIFLGFCPPFWLPFLSVGL